MRKGALTEHLAGLPKNGMKVLVNEKNVCYFENHIVFMLLMDIKRYFEFAIECSFNISPQILYLFTPTF